MKLLIRVLALTLFASNATSCCAVMAVACGSKTHGAHGNDSPDRPAAEAAKPDVQGSSNSAYSMTTCVVSGEKLGSMGNAVDYVHKEEGKPDRLVRFCCASCIKKFKKDPAKYLAKLDEAEKAEVEEPAAKP